MVRDEKEDSGLSSVGSPKLLVGSLRHSKEFLGSENQHEMDFY